MIDSIVWGSEDSLYCTPSSREQEAELIRSFIRCEWAVTKGTVDKRAPEFSDKSMPVVYPKVPQQENGYDCGVFLLMVFEQFLKCKARILTVINSFQSTTSCQANPSDGTISRPLSRSEKE
ncbi:sentrin-specific protease 7-like [Montipora foliosa]|uniref:sentrin-specific protease 7-like n=1 Tax=Montipora foliosa TaxID=591990 RepID=UPI0035F1EB70